MNRRGFLTSLGALATTAVMPSVPSIPIGHVNPVLLKVSMEMNAMIVQAILDLSYVTRFYDRMDIDSDDTY